MASSSQPERTFVARLRRLSARDWSDLLRAVGYLAVARYLLSRRHGGTLVTEARQVSGAIDPDLAHRVALAIARTAARVPWRSDCLVQALAAQRWLHRSGLGSQLLVGARNDAAQGFAAHAWLIHDGITVTGGDVSSYRPFATPAR